MQKAIIIFLFLSTGIWAHAGEYYLQGTIGTFKVAIHLEVDADTCTGSYFYTSYLQELPCSGSKKGNEYKLYVAGIYEQNENTDTTEQFTLHQNNDKSWTGEWESKKGKSTRYP